MYLNSFALLLSTFSMEGPYTVHSLLDHRVLAELVAAVPNPVWSAHADVGESVPLVENRILLLDSGRTSKRREWLREWVGIEQNEGERSRKSSE